MLRLVASWGDRKPHPRIEQFRSMAVKHVETVSGRSRASQAPFRKRKRYMNSRYLFMLIGAGRWRPDLVWSLLNLVLCYPIDFGKAIASTIPIKPA